METIQRYQELLGFKRLSPVQQQVIPKMLKKEDVIVSAPTGTGKSHAFIFPLCAQLNPSSGTVQATLIAPTALLAEQLYEMVTTLVDAAQLKLRVLLFTGGKDKQRELKKCASAQPHIAIGTPGRLHDLALKENALKLHTTRHLVIDEADMTLDAGFLPTVDALARIMPQGLHMAVFSATIPQALEPFLKKYMNQPKRYDLTHEVLKQLNITHQFIYADPNRKVERVMHFLKDFNPYLAMLFVSHKKDAQILFQTLTQAGYDCTILSGESSTRERKQLRRDLESLRVQYVIATDVAARGFDVAHVSHILNYDLPHNMTFYLHRIGRTGRMGQHGEAITFYSESDLPLLRKLTPYGIDIDHLMKKHKKKRG